LHQNVYGISTDMQQHIQLYNNAKFRTITKQTKIGRITSKSFRESWIMFLTLIINKTLTNSAVHKTITCPVMLTHRNDRQSTKYTYITSVYQNITEYTKSAKI